MKLLIMDGVLHCPICEMRLIPVEKKYQVSAEAKHPESSCTWSGFRFRAHPVTGYAERIKETA